MTRGVAVKPARAVRPIDEPFAVVLPPLDGEDRARLVAALVRAVRRLRERDAKQAG